MSGVLCQVSALAEPDEDVLLGKYVLSNRLHASLSGILNNTCAMLDCPYVRAMAMVAFGFRPEQQKKMYFPKVKTGKKVSKRIMFGSGSLFTEADLSSAYSGFVQHIGRDNQRHNGVPPNILQSTKVEPLLVETRWYCVHEVVLAIKDCNAYVLTEFAHLVKCCGANLLACIDSPWSSLARVRNMVQTDTLSAASTAQTRKEFTTLICNVVSLCEAVVEALTKHAIVLTCNMPTICTFEANLYSLCFLKTKKEFCYLIEETQLANDYLQPTPAYSMLHAKTARDTINNRSVSSPTTLDPRESAAEQKRLLKEKKAAAAAVEAENAAIDAIDEVDKSGGIKLGQFAGKRPPGDPDDDDMIMSKISKIDPDDIFELSNIDY